MRLMAAAVTSSNVRTLRMSAVKKKRAVFAAYDENGALIKTVTENLIIDDSGKKSASLSNYLDVTYANAKVFLWESLESMMPMCERALVINN